MGVRGLTGFIARNAEKYLTPYELHDCNLVIDGDNLACNLYKDVTGTCSAFGGDYDDFYRAVVNFFVVLAECNISAYVLMDGGYEQRKLRTVDRRMRGKISVIKRINPSGSLPVFPLMLKEVFVDAVKDCSVPVMRCVFEADDELAALGRKLNCPVLSYDSDFYIHNVCYIPLITLTVKAHTKSFKNAKDPEDASTRSLRRNEAKKLDKRTKGSRIMDAIVVDNQEKPRKGKTYKYLDCCIYRIENLIACGSLSKEKLPLFAAMLGNDYISRSCFRNFFLSGMGKIGRSRKASHQQRRIKLILEWLKNETAETALKKILTRLQKQQRNSLLAQVEAATSGYSNEVCHSYNFLKSNYPNAFEHITQSEDENEEDNGCDEEFDGEEMELEAEEQDESCEEEESISGEEQDDDDKEILELEEEEGDCYKNDTQQDENVTESESEKSSNSVQEDNDEDISKFPKWFLDKLYPANLPRFFVDLVHLRKYINNPQVEHFPYNECNEIAIPILSLIYSLLNNVEGQEIMEKVNEDGTNRQLFFTYLTRTTRVTNVQYVSIEIKEKPRCTFDPQQPSAEFIRHIFEERMPELQANLLFSEIGKIPGDLKLYFMAVVYWLHRSQHCDLIHVRALIVCAVVLRTIDAKIPAERDISAFNKRFGRIIKKEKQVRDKEIADGVKRSIKDELKSLPIAERMPYVPKSDCYLVQNELLKHFHMQEIFKKKYDLYSSTVLHALAEFQAVVFQLHSLNALLDFPYEAPHMGQLYCGVFIYNLYDLMKCRVDVEYYVKNFIFKHSQLMFDFYEFLWHWCEQFIPSWKRTSGKDVASAINKKLLKKKRQKAKRKETEETTNEVGDPNADMLSGSGGDEFVDLNNKFCNVVKLR